MGKAPVFVIHFMHPEQLDGLLKLYPNENWVLTAFANSCSREELKQIANFQEIRNGNYT